MTQPSERCMREAEQINEALKDVPLNLPCDEGVFAEYHHKRTAIIAAALQKRDDEAAKLVEAMEEAIEFVETGKIEDCIVKLQFAIHAFKQRRK